MALSIEDLADIPEVKADPAMLVFMAWSGYSLDQCRHILGRGFGKPYWYMYPASSNLDRVKKQMYLRYGHPKRFTWTVSICCEGVQYYPPHLFSSPHKF